MEQGAGGPVASARASALSRVHHPARVAGAYDALPRKRSDLQIRNDSARTIYILMRVESHADASCAHTAPPLEPGYSHVYSIPREEPSARVTIALAEPSDDSGGGAIRFIALPSNLRLLSGERLRVVECC